MKYREFTEMTNEEVKQIVMDIFLATRVTNVKRSKRDDAITCKAYIDWNDPNDEIKTITECCEVTLRCPFRYNKSAIEINIPYTLYFEEYELLKKFCFAKGIVPWYKDNPYLQENDQNPTEGDNDA